MMVFLLLLKSSSLKLQLKGSQNVTEDIDEAAYNKELPKVIIDTHLFVWSKENLLNTVL